MRASRLSSFCLSFVFRILVVPSVLRLLLFAGFVLFLVVPSHVLMAPCYDAPLMAQDASIVPVQFGPCTPTSTPPRGGVQQQTAECWWDVLDGLGSPLDAPFCTCYSCICSPFVCAPVCLSCFWHLSLDCMSRFLLYRWSAQCPVSLLRFLLGLPRFVVCGFRYP